jgi:hypothetical protein
MSFLQASPAGLCVAKVSRRRPCPQSCGATKVQHRWPHLICYVVIVLSSHAGLTCGQVLVSQRYPQSCRGNNSAAHVFSPDMLLCYVCCHLLQASLAARYLYADPACNPAGAITAQHLCSCLTCCFVTLLSSPAGLTCGQVSICWPNPQSCRGNSSAAPWQYTCTCKQGQRLNADGYLCTSELQQWLWFSCLRRFVTALLAT